MNGFKNSPHLDKDSLLYYLGCWFQADKWTGRIQRDASKWCTGGKLIFPNENFWMDLANFHGLSQVVWAGSTFSHYTDPAHNIWNPNRQFKLLEERETRIRENKATIKAIEEQLNQTEPTLIPSGS
ncbi:hypothetical protein O181_129312 [Austropuccinia psidii MF-1]|uniref:Tet-like 2OG-Fe(II) oxygenase domain-containing protein n=1 Tax=Austropuccinia psidii MF-1 TaxID=1389203 RepID=A0A9Q3QBC5_9BASI|nr:hypothetical protein [Austropuccinia psidii MF-1]